MAKAHETFALHVAQEFPPSTITIDYMLPDPGIHESDKCICTNLLQENS